jgi:L-fuconolactonase
VSGDTRLVVDSHAHIWQPDRPGLEWLADVPELDRPFLLDQLPGADRTAGAVIVQAVDDEDESRWLLAEASSNPRVRAVVGWVDLAGDDPAGRLELLAASPGGELLAGIRHLAHIDPDPEWLVRERTGRGLAAVARAGLAFDLVVRPWQLGTAARVADAHPELLFVLDHLGQPPAAEGEDFDAWRSALAALAARPNVVAKVSGIATRRPDAEARARLDRVLTAALEAFEPERLMFGSDWPLVNLADGYDAWHAQYLEATSALSPAERGALDERTALTAYGAPG